jgi:hypothetical protein
VDLDSILTAALRLYAAKVGVDNKSIAPVIADKLSVRLVQAAPALSIEVTEAFGLELIGHHPEYEVAGKVRRA